MRENLDILVKQCGSVRELASRLDREPSQISQWRNASTNSGTGKPRRISADSARYIEERLGLPVGWMDVSHADTENGTSGGILMQRRVPLISFVQAGNWTEATDPYATGNAYEWLTTDLDLSRQSFALKIKGNSMSPEYNEGDVVIIDPSLSPRPGDFVVAKNDREGATFKKYRPRGINAAGEDVFELVPLNEDFAPLRSDREPIQIIGVMVEHRRYRRR